MRWFMLALVTCVLTTSAAAQDAVKSTKRPTRRPNLISVEEIDQIRHVVSTAWEVVQRLRPSFLRTRGPNSFGNAAGGSAPTARVVVDGSPRGDINALKELSAAAVREIRYLNAADASTLYGTNYGGGAIVVLTH